jgi:hypothetical protein
VTTNQILPQTSFTNQIRRRGLFPAIGREVALTLAEAIKAFRAVITFLFGPRCETTAEGNDRLYLTVTITSVIASLFLASVSFAGSYTAARAYAIRHGIAPSVAAWIPVSVDGFILLAILVVFGASLVAAPAGWVRFLILIFTIISVVFNVAHITETAKPTVENILLASVFPVVIFLASEITSHQITAYIKRRSAFKSNEQLLTEIEALAEEKMALGVEIEQTRATMLAEVETEREQLQAGIERLEAQLKRLKAEKRKAAEMDDKTKALLSVAVWYGHDQAITGREIGDRLGGKSEQYANSLKREVKKQLNGAHHYAS